MHVGLHKTGTSFCREEIYKKLIGDVQVSEYPLKIKKDFDGLTILDNPFFSGDSFTVNPCLRYEYLDKMVEWFPDASIVIGLRGFDDWCNSLWREYLTGVHIGRQPFREFMVWKDEVFDPKGLTAAENMLYVRRLQELFPRVHVCWYETLRDDPTKFVSDICRFIGVDVPPWQNNRYKVSMPDESVYKLQNKKFRGKERPPKDKLFG